MKSFLFVMQAAAYRGSKVQEVLDQVLIAAAFDQQVSMLLLDDAVYHLQKDQLSEQIACKDIAAIYRSLEIYDIENIYVEQDSLTERGLSQDELLIPITLIKRHEITATINRFDVVLSA
ncbi:sulfur relay protein TusC [Methyloprofundus sedimenti]|uniref:Sulfur relay protein TusC n=1 Tax=Methyloprofundus sedimenti TaxID=1420851 RepID=A0A1V8MA86_9GAMM|nr:sulfurtransferase complex subunit TusC [Methyloprofundus sedimenti]OQK18479.1 sulfur relay protein TusC [Methyloprofundus sedimenti]